MIIVTCTGQIFQETFTRNLYYFIPNYHECFSIKFRRFTFTLEQLLWKYTTEFGYRIFYNFYHMRCQFSQNCQKYIKVLCHTKWHHIPNRKHFIKQIFVNISLRIFLLCCYFSTITLILVLIRYIKYVHCINNIRMFT